MAVWLKRLDSIHRLCVQQLIYPLVLSSLLAGGLWIGRVYFGHTRGFSFLTWNLFLAWIPFGLSMAMTWIHRHRSGQWWLLLVPGLLWLIFLPNAPYIVTDILHLDERPPVPLWYDMGLLATYAWTGCFLGVVSLSQVQQIVREAFGNLVSWLFALMTLGLSGLGIYLGRFLDWNSWDLFFQPTSVLADVAVRFIHPIQYRQTFGVTAVFAAFMLVCYITFVSIEHRQAERAPN